jgi:hypothetical protein
MGKSSGSLSPRNRSAARGVILDLRGVPATPERLVELTGTLYGPAGSTLVLLLGEHFPWTFDERLRSPFCYPEEVMKALSAEALRADRELVPGADLITGLHELCHLPSYRRVTSFLQSRSRFHSASTGAAALARELLQDLIALFPDSRQVYLGGDCSGCVSSDIEDFANRFLVPILRTAAEEQRVPILHENCLGSCPENELENLRGEQEAVVIVALDDMDAACRRSLRYRKAGYENWLSVPAYSKDRGTLETRPQMLTAANAAGSDWARVLIDCRTSCGFFEGGGLLLEEYAALFASAGDERAGRIARRLADFRSALDECWVWLRRLRETLVMAVHDPRKRAVEGFGTDRLLNLARLNAGAARLHAHEAQELARGRVDSVALSRTIYEQVAPVDEELAILEERIRQLGSYPS